MPKGPRNYTELLSTRVSPERKQQVDAYAKQMERSNSWVVKRALDLFFNQSEEQVLEQKAKKNKELKDVKGKSTKDPSAHAER